MLAYNDRDMGQCYTTLTCQIIIIADDVLYTMEMIVSYCENIDPTGLSPFVQGFDLHSSDYFACIIWLSTADHFFYFIFFT